MTESVPIGGAGASLAELLEGAAEIRRDLLAARNRPLAPEGSIDPEWANELLDEIRGSRLSG